MEDNAPLSVAANAFAIVGLADVIFRSGKQLYDIYSRTRNAPTCVAQLLEEIRASTSVIAHVRIFVEEFKTSPFAVDDGHSLPQIKTILTLIGHEFEILAQLIMHAQGSASDGWLGQFAKNLRWAMGDQRIAQSCQRLQRLTISMNAALSVTGMLVNRN